MPDPAAACPFDLARDYNPFQAPQLDDPHPIWAFARDTQPVFYSDVLRAWVVTRYPDVVHVLRHPEVFGPVVERKLFAAACPEAERLLDDLPALAETNANSAEPPTHGKLRRYLQPALAPHRIAPFEVELREMAQATVDGFVEQGHGDFYALYGYPYPLAVIRRILGLSDEHSRQIKQWAGQRAALRYGDLTPPEQIEAAQGQHDYYAFGHALVARCRATPGDDLLSRIVQDSDASDDPLSDAQLASQALVLMTAGHETSSHLMTMTIHRLLGDGGSWWRRLVEDPSAIPAVVEESLRFDGPAQSLWRRAKVSADVGGVQIPAGATVSVVLGSANADTEVFHAPEEFDPARSNNSAHLAFGRGIHTCLGAGLARLEARVSLEVLAARLPRLRLAPDDGYMFTPSAIQRMARRLFVEWT